MTATESGKVLLLTPGRAAMRQEMFELAIQSRETPAVAGVRQRLVGQLRLIYPGAEGEEITRIAGNLIAKPVVELREGVRHYQDCQRMGTSSW